MVDKKEIENLMVIADKVLRERNTGIVADKVNCKIYDSYNGQIAALGVSISMIGLIPTLAIYYQDSSDDDKPNRRTVLKTITEMLDLFDSNYRFGGRPYDLLARAIALRGNEQKRLKKNVMSCAIALKHVVRTYKLVKYGQES